MIYFIAIDKTIQIFKNKFKFVFVIFSLTGSYALNIYFLMQQNKPLLYLIKLFWFYHSLYKVIIEKRFIFN